MTGTASTTSPQLPEGIVALGEQLIREGNAKARLGRALKNPRSSIATIVKRAEEAGCHLGLSVGAAGSAECSDGHPGVPPENFDPLANLQCLLRSVGEYVSMEWLRQRSEQEWVALGHYASDIAYGYSRPDYSTTVPRPAFLPPREEAGA